MKRKIGLFILLIVVLVAAGCANKEVKGWLPVSGEKVETVTAQLINAEGNEIGEVLFVEEANGVTLTINAEGLPGGEKGVHLHQTGKCTPPDFKSAGEHFNPEGKEHGFDNPKGYHLGDLPNIEVDKDGMINASLTTSEITLKKGEPNSILDEDGTTLVIHAGPDDYKTNPAGNSGDRIACAAISGK